MKRKIAANTFIWHSPLTDAILSERIPILAEWGFDAVELPLENIGDWDPVRARDLLAQYGMTSVVGAVFGPGRELAAASSEVQAATRAYVDSAIDVAAQQGAPMVIGPMYTSVGRTWRLDDRERSAFEQELRENYRRLADYAGERGVQLAVEPLNRYETSAFNTVDQLLGVIDELDPEVVGLNLDTYHMNIEERSSADAIRRAGSRLLHLQVCGSDRGAPGGDQTPWQEIFAALDEVGYEGLLGIESFTPDNQSIARAASIWRPLARTQDELATAGLEFLRTFG